ncbi:MAG: serine hydrolase domain-containing protein [Pseudomonadota bacterium]
MTLSKALIDEATMALSVLKFLSVIAFSLTLALGARAQTAGDLETDLIAILEESAVVGAGIVVVQNGSPVVDLAWGMADLVSASPVTGDTVFRAGSISKNVTSLMAVRLVQQGTLNLNDLVADIAPDIQINNPWSETDPVRVVHLLEHTAGLPGSSYREYTENRPDASPADYLEAVGTLRLRWRPGTLYSYSNAGHTLLARVLEQATGRSFDDLAKSLVFDELDMQSASFLTYGAAPTRLSRSYAISGREEPTWEMLIRPSGSLTVTARDLAQLAALYANEGAGLVPAEAIDRMQRSEASSVSDAGVGRGAYGLGTFAFIPEGLVFRGHWGRTEGFRASMGYVPGTGAGFVILLNTADDRAAGLLRARIAQHLKQDLGASPLPERAEIDRGALETARGVYVIATHEQPMRAWLFKALDQRRITTAEDGLIVSGMGLRGPPARRFYPAAAGGYVAEGLPLATAALVTVDERQFWIDRDAYVKVSAAEAAFRRLSIPAMLGVSLIAVLHAAVWGLMGLLGRGPRGDGLWIRAALLASGLGFLATSGLFVSFGLLSGWAGLANIGQPTLVSITMAGGSILAVIGALTALGLTGRRLVQAPGVFLLWAGPASLVLSSVAVLWILVGWFPLVSWAW